MGNALDRALRQRVHRTHHDQSRHLAHWFENPDGAIDYDRYADAFAVSYLLPNYWKAAHALHSAAPRSRPNIVDLGSGSGAATWAALAWMADRSDAPDHVEIRLLDRSARALTLARELSEEVLASLPNLHARIRVEQTDLRDVAEVPSTP